MPKDIIQVSYIRILVCHRVLHFPNRGLEMHQSHRLMDVDPVMQPGWLVFACLLDRNQCLGTLPDLDNSAPKIRLVQVMLL